jgi:hypothetical protein
VEPESIPGADTEVFDIHDTPFRIHVHGPQVTGIMLVEGFGYILCKSYISDF